MNQFDLAGFDPENDEETYFEAEYLMESDGLFGGTDADRDRIRTRFRVRDGQHWHTIKESVWEVLAQKHGSFAEAVQRMISFSSERARQWRKWVAAQDAHASLTKSRKLASS